MNEKLKYRSKYVVDILCWKTPLLQTYRKPTRTTPSEKHNIRIRNSKQQSINFLGPTFSKNRDTNSKSTETYIH